VKKRAVVDSSVWIELLLLGKRHAVCRKAFDSFDEIVVPTVVFYEVYKKIAAQVSEEDALAVVGEMSRHVIADLDRTIALLAADVSRDENLGMADSLVLAHARAAGAKLLSLDNDFATIADVQVLR
jgi:predicted nucleic acid-binding protein